MALRVEIDKASGFCGGVINAINRAEKYLRESDDKKLYSLGAIVHNEAELDRLSHKGLITISKEDIIKQSHQENYLEEHHEVHLKEHQEGEDSEKTLLIRAHGEPPETYVQTKQSGYKIIDCTCPVVLKLQKSIKEAWIKLHSDEKNKGHLIIFGKIGHAEVLGLLGQTDWKATVVQDKGMLLNAIKNKEFSLDGPIEIFSQTTKSPKEYTELCELLEEIMAEHHNMSIEDFAKSGLLNVHNTICRQVATRHSDLINFAINHDIIIFVAGKESSNGKVLCDLCKSANIRTYHVTCANDIKPQWLRWDDNVGVCGATSTPKWLLEDVAAAILKYNDLEDSFLEKHKIRREACMI